MLRARCAMAFHSDECMAYRSQLDYAFAKTNTSILNIYAPCYYQNLGANPKNSRLSLRSKPLRGELSCDDMKGAFEFFNDPSIRLHLHIERFPLN